jgi:hypothetical protein
MGAIMPDTITQFPKFGAKDLTNRFLIRKGLEATKRILNALHARFPAMTYCPLIPNFV